eukprot:110867_1
MANLTKRIDVLLGLLNTIPCITQRKKDYSVEICVDSVQSAEAAFVGGADRVELCSSLMEGGLTPSYGLIVQVLKCAPHIEVHIMIRPRSGDFLYNTNEMNIMLQDIDQIVKLKQSNAYPNLKGIVSGFLDVNGNIDVGNLSQCLNKIRNTNLEFTFHRAFDMSNDTIKAADICIKMGVNRILTSGAQPNAQKGLKCILNLIQHCNDRIIIAAGGGIRVSNIHEIVNAQTKAIKHIHGTFRTVVKACMNYQKTNMHMGAATVNGCNTSEYNNKYADAALIKQIVKHMDTLHALD